MQVVEILDNILEQFAPKQEHLQYTPQIRKTLSACLSVCRKVRHLAAERLFLTLHVKCSFDPHCLDTLLQIIEPPSLEWMSIRPFVRNFILSIGSSIPSVGSSTVVQSFLSDRCVPLFHSLAVSGGRYGSRITHFEFRAPPPDTPLFNPAFEDAVLRFMKLPTLRSLEIQGRFLTRDFLVGTHIRDVGISGHGIDLNHVSNDLYTEDVGADVVASAEDGLPDYPRLRRFRTDLIWPPGIPDRAVDFIFRELSCLRLEINISHVFTKAEDLIKRTFATLTTLVITYNFDGYEAELPTSWTIDFGELQALETLEFNWNNSLSPVHHDTIVRGCRPLAGLHSLLDTIRIPMRSLTTIRWNFRYSAPSLPPDILSQWLESDVRWKKLDESLASDLFPALQFVSLLFRPIQVLSCDALNSGGEDDDRLIVLIDFDLVESIISENRQRIFPSLTLCLGENFEFKAAGPYHHRQTEDSIFITDE